MTGSQKPQKKIQHLPRNVHLARFLKDTVKNIYVAPMTFGKVYGNKRCSIQPSPDDYQNRVTVVVDYGPNGVWLKDWSVEDSEQYGNTYFKFPVLRLDQCEGLDALDNKFIDQAADKSSYPNQEDVPSRETVVSNYIPILKKACRKKDKEKSTIQKPVYVEPPEYWPRPVKVKVPMRGNGTVDTDRVDVLDGDGNVISIYEVRNQKLARVGFEVHYMYWRGKEVGVVKELTFIQLCKKSATSADTANKESTRGLMRDLAFLDEEDDDADLPPKRKREDLLDEALLAKEVATEPSRKKEKRTIDDVELPPKRKRDVLETDEDLLAMLNEAPLAKEEAAGPSRRKTKRTVG